MATKDYSSKQEKLIANYLGWKVVTGSGARPCVPGDIQSDLFLGECKTHVASDHSIYFDAKVWSKICEEASSKHRYPVLITDDGSQSLDKTWCVVNVSRIDSTLYQLLELSHNGIENITVDHNFLNDTLNAIKCKKPNLIGFSASLGRAKVAILKVSTFKEIVNE